MILKYVKDGKEFVKTISMIRTGFDSIQYRLNNGQLVTVPDQKRVWVGEDKVQSNLDAVIYSLEMQQKQNYDSINNLVLSYLKDIKNNTVPDYVHEAYQNRSLKK